MSTSAHPAPDDSLAESMAEHQDDLPRRNANELVAASGLPDAACELILLTVKRTRLSRREQAGVASELVAHFADGLDAGSSMDDLIAGFGDKTTVAKLIRRAKLRGRSWPRRVMRRTGQALVCLIVFYIGAMGYYAMGRPNVAVDYVASWNDDRPVPEAERAWPVYRATLMKLDRNRVEEVFKMKGLDFDTLSPPTTGASWVEAVKLVTDNQAVIATTRRVAAMEHLGYRYANGINDEDAELWPAKYAEHKKGRANREGSDEARYFDASVPFTIYVLLPHIEELRRLARLLQLDALHAAQLGDGDRVLADVVAMLGMARQQHKLPTLIENLVATNITMQAVEVIAHVLRHHRDVLSEAHLRQLAHAFAGEDIVPTMNLEVEWNTYHDVAQRVYTDDGHGDGRLTVNGLMRIRVLSEGRLPELDRGTAIAMAPLTNIVSASRKEMTALHKELMDDAEARFATPYWETRSKETALEAWHSSSSKFEQLRYWAVTVLTPALGHAHAIQQSAVGRRDGILVALALEIHRQRHDSYPKSLDELSPNLLPSVPRDRFTGTKMLYRAVGDQAVVYSVGQDLDDDDGVLPADVPKSLIEIPDDVDEKTTERYRKHNEKLKDKFRNETPNGRRHRIEKAVSPAGRCKDTPDGDWVLWYSAGWPVEREAIKSKDD